MELQQAIATPARPRNVVPQPATRVRRPEVRVTIRVAIRPLGNGSREVYGWVQNMSPGGMFVRCTEMVQPDSYCNIRLIWRDGQVFQAAFIKGWTVYGAEGGMGIQFDPNDQEAAEAFVRLARRQAVAA